MKTILPIICLLIFSLGHSQTMSVSVISSLNTEFTNGNYSISGIVGETVVEGTSKDSYLFSSGFTHCSLIFSSSEDTLQNSGISLYPNPNFGDLYISVGNINANLQIGIYNAIGQLMLLEEFSKTQTNLSLDISSLERGTYFVRTVNSLLINEKIIKL